MNRVLSTHLIANHRLTTSWLGRVEAAGIEGVEIFCARQHFDYRDRSQVEDLGHWFRDSQLKLHSVHSPLYTDLIWGRSGPDTHINIAHRVKAERMRWVAEIKCALEIADIIPFRYLVQHLGVSGQEFSEQTVDAAFTALEELTIFARQRGVEILLENTPNELSSAERLQTFNALTHLNLNYVFDVGHAHMGAGIEAEFGIMRNRIRSTHLHDNDGVEDRHLFPLMAGAGGTIDWKRTMKTLGSQLTSQPGQYPLMLELREAPEMQNPVAEAARILAELEALK